MTARLSPSILAPLLALGALGVLAACPGGTGGGGVVASGVGPAELRQKLLQLQGTRFPQRQFYVGIGAGATLEAATAAAYGEVTRQLTWLAAGSHDLLRGLYRVEKSASDSSGSVQALASLEREGAAAHLRKVSREAEAEAKTQLADCEAKLKAGEVAAAQAGLQRAQRSVAQARDHLAASRAAVGDQARVSTLAIEEEANRLAAQLGATQTGRRTVLLRVLRELDGRAAGTLDSELSSLITDRGLKLAAGDVPAAAVKGALGGGAAVALQAAREAGAGYVMVGRVAATFHSEDSGQFFSLAEGAVRLLETAGGRVLAEASCQDVKGGHIARRQANEKAVKEALAVLTRQLRPKLEAALR